MAADHPEDTKSAPDKEELDQGQGPRMAGDSARSHGEEPTSPQSEEPRKVVKRPAIGSLAQFKTSELYKSQFSAAEQMRKILGGTATEQMRNALGGSAAEQMRKAMGGSVVEQMQSIARSSIGEQMRQIEQAIRPLNSIQDTIGHLARSVAESPMRQFLEEQASRHRQMAELLHPKWHQTLVGSALADSFRVVDSFKSFQQAELLRTQAAIRQQFTSVANLLEALRPKLPSFAELTDFWLRYPARVKENLVALATAGWYLDPEMSTTDIVSFKQDLENRTAEEVNGDLALHFRSSLDRIEASLCADHPARAHLIKDAFEAHRQGKYSLSIPALFAQADGICYDLTGLQIFARNGINRFAKRIDADTLERAYLEPLLRMTPLAESSQRRRGQIPQLNRHAVMHGESTTFPSEENGLKAISFVNFVSHVLGMAVAWESKPPASLAGEDHSRGVH